MRSPATTTISSRGQVVIPDGIRKSMRLEPRTSFLVLAKGDTIVLHRLKEPAWEKFSELTNAAATQAHHLDRAVAGFGKALRSLKNLG
jgi:AbrB family looped-hinge helix DNA binding protein